MTRRLFNLLVKPFDKPASKEKKTAKIESFLVIFECFHKNTDKAFVQMLCLLITVFVDVINIGPCAVSRELGLFV